MASARLMQSTASYQMSCGVKLQLQLLPRVLPLLAVKNSSLHQIALKAKAFPEAAAAETPIPRAKLLGEATMKHTQTHEGVRMLNAQRVLPIHPCPSKAGSGSECPPPRFSLTSPCNRPHWPSIQVNRCCNYLLELSTIQLALPSPASHVLMIASIMCLPSPNATYL